MKTSGISRISAVVAAVALFATCLLVLGGMEKPAEAAFPGVNGKIVFASRPVIGDIRDYAEILRALEAQEIYTMNPDGSDRTNLTNNSVYDGEPMWSPNGSKIVFTSGPAFGNNLEIHTMDADGSNVVRLTSHSPSDIDPAWSPNGSKIAFTSERDGNLEIYVMDADGSNAVRLTNNPADDHDPAWSPDGSIIAFTSGRNGDDNAEIYTMNPDGSDQTNLTRHPPDIFGQRGDDQYPAWSPDGSKLTFTSERDTGLFDFEKNKIFIMNRDGSSVRPLTPNAEYALDSAWSPDGSIIAFTDDYVNYWDREDDSSEIYTMNPDGSNQINLTNSLAFELNPDWGPADTTPPELRLPGDITKVATGSDGAVVNFTATATDDVDGSVPINCSPVSGSLFPIGATTVDCSATDAAGNRATGSFQVKVTYAFGSGSGGGFSEPVSSSDLNTMKAGAGVPVKFGLGGYFGLDIFAQGYPTSRRIDCNTGLPPDPIEETVAVSTSGLHYDAAAGQYVYNWKTDRAWSGTCRQLILGLGDGTFQRANFKFR